MAYSLSINPTNLLAVKTQDGKSCGCLMHTKRSLRQWHLFTPRAIAQPESKIDYKRLGLSIEEAEAAVINGNVPPAPPVPAKPKAPAGTPVVPLLPLTRRPRRNRKSAALRAAFQETTVSPQNFILPLFIHEGEADAPIGAMPGCYRLGWRHGLLEEVYKARDVGVNSVVLFPKIPDALKSATGDEAYNENGLVPRAIRLLKDKYPDIVIYTDVALDPYSCDGHDGIVSEDDQQGGPAL